MEFIKNIKNNTESLEKILDELINENQKIKEENIQIKKQYEDLQHETKQKYGVSFLKSMDSQVNELKMTVNDYKKRNDDLKKKNDEYEKEINKLKRRFDFEIFTYKDIDYLLESKTNKVYINNNNEPGDLFGIYNPEKGTLKKNKK